MMLLATLRSGRRQVAKESDMHERRQDIAKYTLAVVAGFACALHASAAEFRGAWPRGVERVWVGPEYYANRLGDWRIADERLECIEASEGRPMRTVHLLTAALDDSPRPFETSVRLGPMEAEGNANAESWAGM